METNENSTPAPGIAWIKLSVIYLVIGVGMGIAMGASQDFTLRPVHAHVNLLGWASLALAGLIYTVFPSAANNWLAKVHFWLMNVALPIMMGSLALVLTGSKGALPALVTSEMVAAIAVLAFAANVLFNLRADTRE